MKSEQRQSRAKSIIADGDLLGKPLKAPTEDFAKRSKE